MDFMGLYIQYKYKRAPICENSANVATNFVTTLTLYTKRDGYREKSVLQLIYLLILPFTKLDN